MNRAFLWLLCTLAVCVFTADRASAGGCSSASARGSSCHVQAAAVLAVPPVVAYQITPQVVQIRDVVAVPQVYGTSAAALYGSAASAAAGASAAVAVPQVAQKNFGNSAAAAAGAASASASSSGVARLRGVRSRSRASSGGLFGFGLLGPNRSRAVSVSR